MTEMMDKASSSTGQRRRQIKVYYFELYYSVGKWSLYCDTCIQAIIRANWQDTRGKKMVDTHNHQNTDRNLQVPS